MNTVCRTLTVLAVAILLSGCEEIVRTGLTTTGSSDEESANRLTLDETYDHTRNGARLILVYNTINNAFEGTVENTTAQTLDQVRVEIHLSNGTELGTDNPARFSPRRENPGGVASHEHSVYMVGSAPRSRRKWWREWWK